MTFYQFVASYQGGEKAATRYLGINITEYFVKRNISVFNNIVSRKIFGAIFVLEILYKPFITIYGDMLSIEIIRVMNFTWFFFVIFYFVVFVFLFFQCTKSILMIKLSSDVKTNGYLIRDINNMFLKKTLKERSDKNAIELLAQDLAYLHEAIRLDDNPELQGRYNQLIYSIFSEYMKRKKYEISVIEKKGKILKNQVPWIYNANYEAHLIMEILEEKYFQLDDDNIRLVSNFHIDLLELNFKRAVLEGYNKVSCNIFKWVQCMRYNIFAQQNSFPEKLNITLRGLLLTNINAVVVANYTYLSCYINAIGTYLLIKLHELSDKTQKQKRIKEIVKKAFTASNMNIDEYINMIEKECRICRCEINYVQKEKIKEYLMRTF